jgi:hypothetical protein
MKKGWFCILLFLLSCLGIALVLLSTRWGAFVSDDSYYYIKPVRDVLAGKSFNPSPIFPPMLPVFLTILGWLGLEPLDGIRVLNAVLFGVNIFMAGVLVRKMGASNGLAFMAALLVTLSDNAIEAHSWAMSEALCIALSLLALYMTVEFIEAPKLRWLVGSGLMAALACLTRYAALPVVAAISLGLAILNYNRKIAGRIGAATVVALISLLPLAAYILRNTIVLGRPLYYPTYQADHFTPENLKWYSYNTLSWFMPGRFIRDREIFAALGFIALLTAGGVAFWLKHRRALTARTFFSPPFWLLLLFVLMNYLMLYFARGLTFLAVYNTRYLVPPLIVLWMVLVYLLDRLWQTGGKVSKGIISLICIGFLAYYGYRASNFVHDMYRTGMGYLNIGWHQSETIPYLKQHPDTPIVATGDIGIYFWTGKLPKSITAFGSLNDMRDYICQNNSILVIMKQMPTTIYHLDEADVISGLAAVREFNDSMIYQCR